MVGVDTSAASERIQTAVAYLDAGMRGDNDTVVRLLGESFVWIDHSQGVVASTIEELLQVAEEHAGWTDRVFDIERAMETVDGTVIAQGRITQTHMGVWRSIPATGRRITIDCIEIVGFDPEGRVISEEAYQDDLSIMKQLGVLDLTDTT
jgi:steroid delta-isomerase-like uncharacterized protein